MPQFKKGRQLKRPKSPRSPADSSRLRIIGGSYRGRQIRYSGDPITRPMKDDIREAVFNLVGGWTSGKAVFDLFAGTGAMGLEAMSRGTARVFLVERHFPTVKIIRDNIHTLDPDMAAEVAASDTFFWSRRFLQDQRQWPSEPWLVFCCPPYALYGRSPDQMRELIGAFVQAAPLDSLIVVESDQRFDVEQLPAHENWVVRHYTPAVISILKKFPVAADPD